MTLRINRLLFYLLYVICPCLAGTYSAGVVSRDVDGDHCNGTSDAVGSEINKTLL